MSKTGCPHIGKKTAERTVGDVGIKENALYNRELFVEISGAPLLTLYFFPQTRSFLIHPSLILLTLLLTYSWGCYNFFEVDHSLIEAGGAHQHVELEEEIEKNGYERDPFGRSKWMRRPWRNGNWDVFFLEDLKCVSKMSPPPPPTRS